MSANVDYPLALTIENLKCFRSKQRIDLSNGEGEKHAKWTIILGNNGTGKTTVLQSLCGLAAIKPASITLPDGKSYPFKVPVANLETFSGRRKGFEVSVEFAADAGESERKRIRVNEENIDGPVRATKSGDYKKSKLQSPELDLNLAPLIAYGSFRGRPGLVHWEEQLVLHNESFIEGLPQSLSHPSVWLADLHYKKLAAKNKALFSTHLDLVVDTLVQVLPQVSDIRFPSPKDFDSAPVVFKTDYGYVPPTGLSHGYKALMYWMVDLVRRMIDLYPRVKDPLAMPAVVLVDEIDLHLHPSWQRQLIGYLDERFKRTQFVVTAHSPLIVQSNSDARIVLLKREGDETVVRQDLDAVKHWRLDQILQSELYDFDTLSSPTETSIQEERWKLLRKKELSGPDKRKLNRLNKKLAELVPVGSTDTERRIFELASRIVEKNEKNGTNGSAD